MISTLPRRPAISRVKVSMVATAAWRALDDGDFAKAEHYLRLLSPAERQYVALSCSKLLDTVERMGDAE